MRASRNILGGKRTLRWHVALVGRSLHKRQAIVCLGDTLHFNKRLVEVLERLQIPTRGSSELKDIFVERLALGQGYQSRKDCAY